MAHDAHTDNPHTRGIAEFVSNLKYEAVPPEVLSRIKLLCWIRWAAPCTA